ncbi:hypothetical protein, partial [Flagellimonas sp.]|uniref:hypothetical protein n=1 Tax=Flagellimonas sp. TaxID=2058762 RepID=UPI003AB4D2EF
QNLADVIAIDPSAGNSAITDVLDPTDPQDAATKAYVDGITVTEGEGITVTPSGQEFNVSVTNPIIATGKVVSGTLSATGASLTGSAGSYTVTLSNPPTGDYTVQLTLYNTSGNLLTIQVTDQRASEFDVEIYDSTPSIADANWFFTVIAF